MSIVGALRLYFGCRSVQIAQCKHSPKENRLSIVIQIGIAVRGWRVLAAECYQRLEIVVR
jgi:hypothetical protein